MKILAIETSCDETAAAVVEDGTKILSNIIASSTAMHKKYGGIVPEVAAREQLRVIIPVINEALEEAKLVIDDVDQIAVTIGPGLIGSLLIGVETAKTMSFVTKKPIIPVNHVIAHMFANFVDPSVIPAKAGIHLQKDWIPDQVGDDKKEIQFPAISLVVSGGHTELFLMESNKKLTWLGGTLDDAAGEAFDKTARLLGFENRGGVAIQEAASRHPELVEGSLAHASSDKLRDSSPSAQNDRVISLPRPLLHDKTLNFSFSGLKTAIMREWQKHKKPNKELINEFAYEVQEAITDVLVAKTLTAAQSHQAKSILISGGVSANLRLREKLTSQAKGFHLHFPPIALCTDNAVYIASYAFFKGTPVNWHDITALPDLSVEENI